MPGPAAAIASGKTRLNLSAEMQNRFVSRLLLLAVSMGMASLNADSLSELWKILPGDRPYVGTGNNERGLAYNPVSKKLLLVGRQGGPQVYVLDAASGADGVEDPSLGVPRVLLQTDAEGTQVVAGGTFIMNLVGAADDGAVYVCNLSTSTTAPNLRVYRWANDDLTTTPTVAFEGDPAPGNVQRWGDSFTVRGAGANTQILLGSRAGTILALLTTTDGVTFTSKVLQSNMGGGDAGIGVAFGAGNTLWTKAPSRALRHQSFDPVAGTATTVTSFPSATIPNGAAPIGTRADGQRLATVDYVAHQLIAYDLSDPKNPIQLGDRFNLFPEGGGGTGNANANGTGAATFGKVGEDDVIFALDTNNGIYAVKVVKSVVINPPVIATQPVGASVYESASATLGISVQGTPPFGYQWYFNETILAGQTGSTLSLTNLRPEQAGPYLVVVTNSAGSVTSSVVNVAVRIPLASGVLTPLWALAPGSRPYLNEDFTQRGLAHNPVSGNVLLVSRSGSNQVVVLDGATGAEKHRLRTTDAAEFSVITGGTLPINMVTVTADGVVYAANLVTDGSSAPVRLYRWANDAADTIPTVVTDIPELSVAERWGDTLDSRGAGATTQLLLGSRSGRSFALVSIADGTTGSAKVFEVAEAAAGGFGLGLAFGAGNTVWGTASGVPLHHAAFDPAAGTATLLKSYPAAQIPGAVTLLAYDPAEQLLAGVALETPDNVQLFDLANLEDPVLVDQELILADKANPNGTGAADFGAGRLFVLNSNNGVLAFTVNRSVPAGPATLSAVSVTGDTVAFTLTGTVGATYELQRGGTPASLARLGSYTVPAAGSLVITVPADDSAGFFRVVAP
jgi:hypothetical protein